MSSTSATDEAQPLSATPSFLLQISSHIRAQFSRSSSSSSSASSSSAHAGRNDPAAPPRMALALSPVSSDPLAQHSSVPIFVPPLNFALLSPGIYRSGFPRPENFAQLDSLNLASVVYLADQDMKEDTLAWATRKGLKVQHFRIESNKEPLVQASETDMLDALRFVLDSASHPVLIMCNRGRHRAGLLGALVRRTQGWSLTMVFDEYRRFFGETSGEGGGTKGERTGDYEWIESFDLDHLRVAAG